MNNKYQFTIISVLMLICLSCASVKNAGGKTSSVLPMKNGWYLYDFERTFKGIEDEYNFNISTGMKMVQEITWKYIDGEDAGFTPWALFVQTDGSVACEMEITTVMEMGDFSRGTS